jgi:threonine dehydratase
MVPLTTKQPMVDRLRGFGSEVVQGGNHWAEADEKARALVACTTGGYVRPPSIILVYSSLFELG